MLPENDSQNLHGKQRETSRIFYIGVKCFDVSVYSIRGHSSSPGLSVFSVFLKSGLKTFKTTESKKMAFKLTEAQINEYTKAFNDFDQDGDGHLSCEELGVIMRSIGHNPSPKELQEMMTVADRDASGTIDLLEFLEIMAKKSEEDSSEQDLKEAFSLFDKNGNGVISADELKFVLSGMGCELSDDAAEEMIKQADIDGDGGINFEEFLRLLKDRNEQS